MVYEIRLVPVDSDGVKPSALADGTTVIGRGFQGVSDAHLSRKQLSVNVNNLAGTITTTRLGQNASRVSRNGLVSDLARNEAVALEHGDTLFLVGPKHAFVVEIISLVPVVEADAPTQDDSMAANTIALAGGGPSPSLGSVASLSRQPTPFPKATTNLSLASLISELAPSSAAKQRSRLVDAEAEAENNEPRWTDDEDDDNEFAAAAKKAEAAAAAKAKRRRLERADFSDESDNLFAFEDEAVELLNDEIDSDNNNDHDLDRILARKGAKKTFKKERKKASTTNTVGGPQRKRSKITLGSSSDTLLTSSSIGHERSSPVKPNTPRFTRSRSGSLSQINNKPLIVTVADRKRLVEERRQERIQKRGLDFGDSEDLSAREPSQQQQQQQQEPANAKSKLKKRTSTVAPAAPSKRRVTAYGLYSKAERSKIKKENPTSTSAEITSMLRSRFNLLQDKDRDHYHNLAVQQNGDDNDDASDSDLDRIEEAAEPSSPVLMVGKRAVVVKKETVVADVYSTTATNTAIKKGYNDSGSSGSEEIPLVRRKPVKVIPPSFDGIDALVGTNPMRPDDESDCGSPSLL
ncbi:UNVERIFIED_CONTAM: hypothetical protein HDU68_005224 [Siphonaria sp. JEL0065]|nr:hypothetical protein HDU68_005224 [Siphonaria sp. JEL0065]